MEFIAPKRKSLHKDVPSTRNENPQQFADKKQKSMTMVDEKTREELRNFFFCFWCKEPYNKENDFPLGPKGKGNHIMWAYYEDSDS